jgi:periplasmic protein TonB
MAMFDQTFVDGVGKTHKSWTVTLSFAAEFLAIGVMILIPLIWTEALPKASLVNFLTAPAPPPPPPPPPPPAQVIKVVHVAPRQFNGQTLQAPREIPKQVAMITEDALPPSNIGGQVGGVEGGIPGGTGLGGLGGGGFAPPPPPPPPPPKVVDVKPKVEGPQRVSSGVQQAKLIKHPTPLYPPIAKSARIQGTVVLQAIIGKDGTVQNLKMISSSSPLLVQSAMDAVKQWVYQPTLLNNEPVDVITEITVNFTLQ